MQYLVHLDHSTSDPKQRAQSLNHTYGVLSLWWLWNDCTDYWLKRRNKFSPLRASQISFSFYNRFTLSLIDCQSKYGTHHLGACVAHINYHRLHVNHGFFLLRPSRPWLKFARVISWTPRCIRDPTQIGLFFYDLSPFVLCPVHYVWLFHRFITSLYARRTSISPGP